MICPYCKKEAVWCENKAIYGKNYGKSFMCWLCKDCDASVGCHNNTREPLGTMATRELREWRKKVHAVIDPLWRSKKYSRGQIYAKISREIGKTYHTGQADIEECKKILALNLT